ncbi:MAG: DUF3800 domain-containing protein [Defluviicoccus sp.]|nr:DUF3800 domain-containing protein [Defluviicoccus sp.]MDE0384936.1 DUF3800 domain-containing protein [Defluviicoccus sp.]
MTHFVYLDEFGHVGPYISRTDSRHNASPVFGLAGFALPSHQVRGFATWFYQRKCELLGPEIERSTKIPAVWEKKGSRLYTVANVKGYRSLRTFTNRLFIRITGLGGFVFYVGIRKTFAPDEHNGNRLYVGILREAIKRLDQYCSEDCSPASHFILALDEHPRRSELVTAASQSMFGGDEPRRRLIEPPFHLESHRYQTIQAADWIAALVGRLGAYWEDPDAYPENEAFLKYFGARLNRASRRSGIRSRPRGTRNSPRASGGPP